MGTRSTPRYGLEYGFDEDYDQEGDDVGYHSGGTTNRETEDDSSVIWGAHSTPRGTYTL